MRREHIEGDQLSDGQLRLDHPIRAHPEHRHGRNFLDAARHLSGHGDEAGGTKAGPYVSGKLLLPSAQERRLDGHGQHRLNAADGLNQEGLVLCAAIEFFMQPCANGRRDRERQQRVQRQRGHDHQTEHGAVPPHDDQEDDGEKHIQDDRHGITGQELADLFQLAHARHGVADAPGFEVGKGQRQDMTEQLRAQPDVDPVGGMGKEIGAETAQHGVEHRQRDHAYRQYMERRKSLVHQHFVDDDLCEQRRQ